MKEYILLFITHKYIRKIDKLTGRLYRTANAAINHYNKYKYNDGDILVAHALEDLRDACKNIQGVLIDEPEETEPTTDDIEKVDGEVVTEDGTPEILPDNLGD